jgi:hypothetical protein
MCIDQWGGYYLAAAENLKEAARYGLHNAIFVKHSWQRWGYDYRLPEIYPPAGGLEPFLAMRKATEDAGMLFCPHDNYIDFYPDAEGYSYDHIVFHEDGRPVKAWFNKGRKAQNYRWLPHAFRVDGGQMRHMRDGFAPDSLFIDVFTAIPPFDYYDRAGTFYPGTRTQQEWRDAFDTLPPHPQEGLPHAQRAGTGRLIGSLDGAQSDHFPATRWMKEFGDSTAPRGTTWPTHGKMVIFAGGLGPRYSRPRLGESGPPRARLRQRRLPLQHRPRRTQPHVRRPLLAPHRHAYWLLNDVCDALARATFESHVFGDSIKRQHTTFSAAAARSGPTATPTPSGRSPTANASRLRLLRRHAQGRAGIILIDGQGAGFAKSKTASSPTRAPSTHTLRRMAVESATASGTHLGNGVFEVTFNWTCSTPPARGYGALPPRQQRARQRQQREDRVSGDDSDPADAFKRPGPFTANRPPRHSQAPARRQLPHPLRPLPPRRRRTSRDPRPQ